MAFKRPLPEWNNPGVEPPQSKKDMGWLGREKPPAQWHNWFQHLTYEALKELQENAAHVTFGETEPASPDENDLWVDTSEEQPILKRFDGTRWMEIGKGGVSSVNGKTGDVVLTAEDVGAASNDALNAHLNEIVQPYYEFWVNSDIGDDNNDGKTSSTPFATIKKAIDSVPNGVQGQIRLSGNSPHVIDQDIYLYNKNINLLSVQTATINKLSSARIYVINSSLTGGYQHNWYVEDILFHVAGLSSISLGGHDSCTIRPLSETSNVTVCYLVYSYGSGLLQGYPSFLSFTGRRLRFRTDNFPTYSGTYNVFQKELESGIIVSKFWQLTKDETVNWGLTENVLGDGAGGLSQWY